MCAKLIPVEGVSRAMEACAGAIVRAIEQMPARAEEIAAAVAKDGAAGARGFLHAWRMTSASCSPAR